MHLIEPAIPGRRAVRLQFHDTEWRETMKITVLGAGGGEVTGSAYLVQTRSANVLVDCGTLPA